MATSRATQTSISGLVFPAGFDVLAYDAVCRTAPLLASPNDGAAPWKRNSWFGYASAWNGLAIRLRAAHDYDQQFANLISRPSASAHEDLYLQERALFGCLAASLSAVECSFMSAYCLASAAYPTQFELKTAKDLDRTTARVNAAFERWNPLDPLTCALSQVGASGELKRLADLRNALAHRGLLPRQHNLSTSQALPSTVPSNPKDLANDFAYTLPLSPATTAVHTSWVTGSVSLLVQGINSFLAARV